MNKPIFKRSNAANKNFPLYIQCKGLHSGRPLTAPIPNCFTTWCNSEEEKEYWFWLNWGLWKCKAFDTIIRGSVIPFITQDDYQAVLYHAHEAAGGPSSEYQQTIDTLRKIEDLKNTMEKKIQLFTELQHAYFRKLVPQ